MSADSSPSTEPIPTPSAPTRARRFFRPWQVIAGSIIVVAVVLTVHLVFPSPREKLLGTWIMNPCMLTGGQGIPGCTYTFRDDGTVVSMGKVIETFTWIDESHIRIVSTRVQPPQVATVVFSENHVWLNQTFYYNDNWEWLYAIKSTIEESSKKSGV